MPSSDTAGPNKSTLWAGALAFVSGFIPCLGMFGILPHNNAPVDHSADWLGWLICGMFMATGVILFLRGFLNRPDDTNADLSPTAPIVLRLVHDVFVLAIIGGLAIVLSWVAFGPGARHFSMSIGGWSSMTSGTGDLIGRAAFGLGAILGWAMVWMALVSTIRRWKQLVQ